MFVLVLSVRNPERRRPGHGFGKNLPSMIFVFSGSMTVVVCTTPSRRTGTCQWSAIVTRAILQVLQGRQEDRKTGRQEDRKTGRRHQKTSWTQTALGSSSPYQTVSSFFLVIFFFDLMIRNSIFPGTFCVKIVKQGPRGFICK